MWAWMSTPPGITTMPRSVDPPGFGTDLRDDLAVLDAHVADLAIDRICRIVEPATGDPDRRHRATSADNRSAARRRSARRRPAVPGASAARRPGGGGTGRVRLAAAAVRIDTSAPGPGPLVGWLQRAISATPAVSPAGAPSMRRATSMPSASRAAGSQHELRVARREIDIAGVTGLPGQRVLRTHRPGGTGSASVTTWRSWPSARISSLKMSARRWPPPPAASRARTRTRDGHVPDALNSVAQLAPGHPAVARARAATRAGVTSASRSRARGHCSRRSARCAVAVSRSSITTSVAARQTRGPCRRRSRAVRAAAVGGLWILGPDDHQLDRSRISPRVAVVAPRRGSAGAPARAATLPRSRPTPRAGRQARMRPGHPPRWTPRSRRQRATRAAQQSAARECRLEAGRLAVDRRGRPTPAAGIRSENQSAPSTTAGRSAAPPTERSRVTSSHSRPQPAHVRGDGSATDRAASGSATTGRRPAPTARARQDSPRPACTRARRA